MQSELWPCCFCKRMSWELEPWAYVHGLSLHPSDLALTWVRPPVDRLPAPLWTWAMDPWNLDHALNHSPLRASSWRSKVGWSQARVLVEPPHTSQLSLQHLHPLPQGSSIFLFCRSSRGHLPWTSGYIISTPIPHPFLSCPVWSNWSHPYCSLLGGDTNYPRVAKFSGKMLPPLKLDVLGSPSPTKFNSPRLWHQLSLDGLSLLQTPCLKHMGPPHPPRVHPRSSSWPVQRADATESIQLSLLLQFPTNSSICVRSEPFFSPPFTPSSALVTGSWAGTWDLSGIFSFTSFPRTEEPGGLQSIGLHRVGHDWSDLACPRACPIASQALALLAFVSPGISLLLLSTPTSFESMWSSFYPDCIQYLWTGLPDSVYVCRPIHLCEPPGGNIHGSTWLESHKTQESLWQVYWR